MTDIENTQTGAGLFAKKRRFVNLFIYPQVQLKLIGAMLLVNIIPCILIYLFQTESYSAMHEAGLENGLILDHPFFELLADSQDSFFYIILFSTLVSCALTLFLGVILTHKAAGPMVKLKTVFDAVAKNKEVDGPIYFREGDFFHEVAEAYNARFKK